VEKLYVTVEMYAEEGIVVHIAPFMANEIQTGNYSAEPNPCAAGTRDKRYLNFDHGQLLLVVFHIATNPWTHELIMVFRGKPSKACERCRARRLRVNSQSPAFASSPETTSNVWI
jgi:hypothetical protein